MKKSLVTNGLTSVLLTLIILIMVGCDNESDADSGTGFDADSDTDSGTDIDFGTDSGGNCFELTFNVKIDPQVFIKLSSKTASGEATTDYDMAVTKQSPCPTFSLGPNVTGINLGAEKSFEDVVNALDSGYAADGSEPVVGRTYKTGGSGSTGFIMSGNVYLLKLADGSYAKISVTQAKGGKFKVNAYYSENTDLVCSWP